MSGAATQSRPARDKVSPEYSPIEFERRRKAENRKQARMDEAETDDFANQVQAYAHFNGKNAQEELDREKKYRRTGKGRNPGLGMWLDQAKKDAPGPPSDPETPATPKKAAAPSPAAGPTFSVPGGVQQTASSAGGFVLGLILYGVVISGLKYGVAGVKAYASAKLFNKVIAGPWGGTASSSSSSTTDPGVLVPPTGNTPSQPFYGTGPDAPYYVPPATTSA
jgi:hypothetical protein